MRKVSLLTVIVLAIPLTTGCQKVAGLDKYNWTYDTDSESSQEYGTTSENIDVEGTENSTETNTHFNNDSDTAMDSNSESIDNVDSSSDSATGVDSDSDTNTNLDTVSDVDTTSETTMNSDTSTYTDTETETVTDGDSATGSDVDTGTIDTDNSCVGSSVACMDDFSLATCVNGNWVISDCIGKMPFCFGNACVQCLPGDAECSGYDQRICNSNGVWEFHTCDYGCIQDRCLQQSAYDTPGVVQCDLNVVCPSDKVCCFDIENRKGACLDECEQIENVQGKIGCDNHSDCDNDGYCCSTEYLGDWVGTSCGQCKAPVSELRVRYTCQSEDDCMSDNQSCQIQFPTTTIKICD